MTAKQVSKVLAALKLPVRMTPRGFDLPHVEGKGFDTESRHGRSRIENGSGIAGRGGVWRIALVRSGDSLSGDCSTEKQLRRAILEWEAGPRQNGGTYARRHRTRFTDCTIWVRRSNGD